MGADSARNIPQQSLNIFSPRKASSEKVLIFLYGGSWRSGKKNLYNFLGSRIARKGVVTVIVDYPLSPIANYSDLARATAMALRWAHQIIDHFGGDRYRIFISGISA